MIYLLYISLLIVLLIIEAKKKELSKLCRLLIPILFTLLTGLRGQTIGVDTPTYYDHYYVYGRWGCDFIEPGFDWINRFCFSLGFGANSLFIVMAAITCLFFYLSLNRLNKKEYTIAAFFTYLFTFTFLVNGMRQGVACAIFFYAYWLIVDRKWIRYIACILFASLFHASALLLLPIYLLNKYKFNNKIYIFIYLLSFLGLFIDLSPYLPSIELGNRAYSEYAENVNIVTASSLGFIVTTALNIIIFYLILKNKLFNKFPLLANLVFIAFCLKNIGFHLPIIGRITIYFSWFVFLIYPMICYECKKHLFKSKEFTLMIILLIDMSIWLNSLFSKTNIILPYYFYWEEKLTIVS